LKAEQAAQTWRSIVGYVTLPIGFTPWIGTAAQLAIDKGIGTAIDKSIKSEHRWFYLLSEVVDTH
jgi:hypothetical protein